MRKGGDAMPSLMLGTPNAKQDIFLRDTHRHVGYGGALEAEENHGP